MASFKNYSRDPLSIMPKLAREYGDIVTMRYYNFRVYFVSHPDYIEQVLVGDNRKFIKGRVLRKNKQLFGNGLLTSEGDFWLRPARWCVTRSVCWRSGETEKNATFTPK
jgi:hypothetical protein